jgi:hypothetical protein
LICVKVHFPTSLIASAFYERALRIADSFFDNRKLYFPDNRKYNKISGLADDLSAFTFNWGKIGDVLKTVSTGLHLYQKKKITGETRGKSPRKWSLIKGDKIGCINPYCYEWRNGSLRLMKIMKFLLVVVLLAPILGGCGLISEDAKLAAVNIKIDGNEDEWAPFPVVLTDPEGDTSSYEFDISNIKSFSNSETGKMYVLIESYRTPKDVSLVDLQLQYAEQDIYRVQFDVSKRSEGNLSVKSGDSWDDLGFMEGSTSAIGDVIELQVPMDRFRDPKQLKIYDINIMGGVCCKIREWYTVDSIN